ncbi:MAG: hypothetical protein WC882_04895 [Candidatus Gracilibacteria bacterium]
MRSLKEAYREYSDRVKAQTIAVSHADPRVGITSEAAKQRKKGPRVTTWLAENIPQGSEVLDLFSGTSLRVAPLVLTDHISKLTAVNNFSPDQEMLRKLIEFFEIENRINQILLTLGAETSSDALPSTEQVTMISTGLAVPRSHHLLDPTDLQKTASGITRETRLSHVLKALGKKNRLLYVVEPCSETAIPQVSTYVRTILERIEGWSTEKEWEPLPGNKHIGAILKHK